MAMFQNATSLTTFEATDETGVKHTMSINAGGMAACTQMFENCVGLTSLLIKLPATSVQTSAYSLMFNGCTGILGQSFKLPATSVTDNCYINMFANGCGVADIHYPASLKTDSTFNSMEGSPAFGGYQAYAVFDL